MDAICLHGRGGQGAVLAASILTQVLLDAGKFVLAGRNGQRRRPAHLGARNRTSGRRAAQWIVAKPRWFDVDLGARKGRGGCVAECPHRAITLLEAAMLEATV